MDKTTYGKWTVVGPREGRKVPCQCECGTERRVVLSDLVGGRTKSCGCGKIKHGMERSPEYRIWIDMRRRCADGRRPDFHNYGGRGITVCERWAADFSAFHEDMGPRPDGCQLERRDNDLGYSKDNCVWIPAKDQHRNKRTNRRLKVRGEEITMVEASERFGIGYMTLANRINTLGWADERAVDTPVRPIRSAVRR